MAVTALAVPVSVQDLEQKRAGVLTATSYANFQISEEQTKLNSNMQLNKTMAGQTSQAASFQGRPVS